MTRGEPDGQSGGVPTELNRVSGEIVDAAIAVHSELGPGLLEGVCEACLAFELESRGMKVERQVTVPVVYRGFRIDAGVRLDLRVDDHVIVELKAVDSLLAVHKAQVLTYLKPTGARLGLLINFNVPLLKDGIHRVVL